MNEQQQLPSSTKVIYEVFDLGIKIGMTRIIWSLVVIILALILASGIYKVNKEEQGVLTRFGRLVDAEIEPGLHYRIPFIDEVNIRPVKRITRDRVASIEEGKVNFSVLSGDTNLIEVDIIFQYKIDNLKDFLFTSVDPVSILKLSIREGIVEFFGNNFIDLILTSNRNILENNLFDETIKYVENLDIGLELLSLTIVDIRPIEEAIPAFRDVSDAVTERFRVISDAERRYERLLAHSRGQAEAVVLDASAKSKLRVEQAKANAFAFEKLLEEYRREPDHVAITRYWNRMRTIFEVAKLAAANPNDNATIAINLIDVAGGAPPLRFGSGKTKPSVSATGESMERPLFSTVEQSSPDSYSTITEDKPLISGRFHEYQYERDHMSIANIRSLIFDTPLIFPHGGGVEAEIQSAESPMIEKLATGNVDDGASATNINQNVIEQPIESSE